MNSQYLQQVNPSISGPHLPDELVLAIAKYLWYGCISWKAYRHNIPLGITACRRYAVLSSRDREILHVCRPWRHAVIGEYRKYVFGDCQLEATPRPLAYLTPGVTKAVWLRYDGALLFGSWAIKWTQSVLHLPECKPQDFCIDALIIVIVESPNTATTSVEDMRASCLAKVCKQALSPKQISFFSQPCTAISRGKKTIGVGDRFARLYSHFASLPTESPPLVSIETSRIGCNSNMIWLITAAACSLEYLRIGCLGPSELQQLIYKPNNTHLVFNRLRELIVTLDLNDSQLKPYEIKTLHFPSLALLHIELPDSGISPRHETSLSLFEYSFLIDLFFFRPSSTNMLKIPLAWDTVEVLVPEMLSQVRSLVLSEIILEGEHVLDNEEASQMLSNAFGLQNIRSISLDCATQETALPIFLNCSFLHTLDIPYYTLSANQMAQLLSSLSTLVILNCKLASGNEELTTSADDQVMVQSSLDSLFATYDIPASTSLWDLSVYVHPSTSKNIVYQLFALIGAVPSIQNVTLPSDICPILRNYLAQTNINASHQWSSKINKRI
ncbi:hypothetical protein EDC05_006232 [Coemansia umbellata]|uniref:F-box domain-containing protein n=1 Tax=Coemansia umbellata TaxID=1424467 RepID=A0ABQ8PDD8_9FUNG|nr:hypothetical protein EDC05_006232 [Coemansia umbellata]